jgi:peptide/nickel transport system permease protein
MKKVFTLDFRLEYDQDYTSLDTVLFFLPYTLLLFGTATILCYAIGVFLGIKLLSRKSKRVRTLVTVVSVIFYAIPAFVFAISLKNWFIFKYHIFPPVSVSMGGLQYYPVLDETLPFEHADVFWDLLPAMVLPLSIIVIVGLARPILLLKDHMTLLLDEPYVITAKAKGLAESAVLSHHVARNALLPLFNDASINLALIFSGGILIEYIFSWPGIGTLLFISLRLSYYPTILAAIFLLTVILLIFIVIMDVLNAYVDPRVMQ